MFCPTPEVSCEDCQDCLNEGENLKRTKVFPPDYMTLYSELFTQHEKLKLDVKEVLTDVAQLIDGWNQGECWSEWDKLVRDRVGKLLSKT